MHWPSALRMLGREGDNTRKPAAKEEANAPMYFGANVGVGCKESGITALRQRLPCAQPNPNPALRHIQRSATDVQ